MGITDILRKPKKEKKEKAVSADFKKLKLLVTVVNRNKTEFFIDLIGDLGANMQAIGPAQGTARSDMLHLLGLEDSDKSVLFSVIKEDDSEKVMHTIEDKFHSVRGGKGIAFTIPLSSVIGVAIYRFLSDNRTA